MIHFAFFTEIFFGIGDFFQWTFNALPPIGVFMGWLLSAVILGLLIWWCIQIVGFGKDDKRIVDYREPHNFID
ncbi:hypothetical protein EQP59_10380 [Ornithobacterium rhinotracheale]|uniref:Uncharacterized protein n=1 Tax=Ornithobacterium rhinotracheale TaxID=28251 RepID=A0A410JUH9_ORNRH|nr:hypothetical protein [Ornithobacterium rhinotracheale]QAR31715.1 hypothetical protein EQP59_10380 [Ornithobacterium rhinotracheale]